MQLKLTLCFLDLMLGSITTVSFTDSFLLPWEVFLLRGWSGFSFFTLGPPPPPLPEDRRTALGPLFLRLTGIWGLTWSPTWIIQCKKFYLIIPNIFHKENIHNYTDNQYNTSIRIWKCNFFTTQTISKLCPATARDE